MAGPAAFLVGLKVALAVADLDLEWGCPAWVALECDLALDLPVAGKGSADPPASADVVLVVDLPVDRVDALKAGRKVVLVLVVLMEAHEAATAPTLDRVVVVTVARIADLQAAIVRVTAVATVAAAEKTTRSNEWASVAGTLRVPVVRSRSERTTLTRLGERFELDLRARARFDFFQ